LTFDELHFYEYLAQREIHIYAQSIRPNSC